MNDFIQTMQIMSEGRQRVSGWCYHALVISAHNKPLLIEMGYTFIQKKSEFLWRGVEYKQDHPWTW